MGNLLPSCSGSLPERSDTLEEISTEDQLGRSWSIFSCTEPLLSKRNLLMPTRVTKSKSKKKRTTLSSTRMPTPPVRRLRAPMTEKMVQKVRKMKLKKTELPTEGPPPLSLSSILLFIKYQQRLD